MLKKTITSVLVLFLLNLSFANAIFANDSSEKERKFVEKLKAKVTSQGSGEHSKIKLKLKDGTKLEGYISEISESGLIVVDKKNGQNVSVTYPQVKQAKGNNWSTKQWIGVAAIVGFVVFIFVYAASQKD